MEQAYVFLNQIGFSSVVNTINGKLKGLDSVLIIPFSLSYVLSFHTHVTIVSKNRQILLIDQHLNASQILHTYYRNRQRTEALTFEEEKKKERVIISSET